MSFPPRRKLKRIITGPDDEEGAPISRRTRNATATTTTDPMSLPPRKRPRRIITDSDDEDDDEEAAPVSRNKGKAHATLVTEPTDPSTTSGLIQLSGVDVIRSAPKQPTLQSQSRSQPRRNRSHATTEDDEASNDAAADMDVLNEADFEILGRNLTRVVKCLEGVEILQHREPPQGQPVATSISTFLNCDPYDGRRCVYGFRNLSTAGVDWAIKIRDANKSDSFPKEGAHFSMNKAFFPREFANDIAPRLAKFLERWPFEIQGMSRVAKHQMLLAAYRSVVPGAKKYCNQVCWDTRARHYAIAIRYVDPQTGDTGNYQFMVRPTSITDLQVPDTPDYCVFDYYPGVTTVKTTHLPTIPEGEEGRYDAAKKLCRFIGWKLDGKMVKPADMPRLVSLYESQYTNTKRDGTGPYGGHPLYIVNSRRLERRIYIHPSQAIVQDLSKKPPSVYVKSLLKIRLVPALDAQLQAWVRTGDIIKTWHALAKAADLINEAIRARERPIDECQCTPEMSATELHICGGCLEVVVCASLQRNEDGFRICRVCLIKHRPASLEEKVFKYLKTLIRRDINCLGMSWDEESNQAIQHRARVELKKSLISDTKWRDCYSTATQERNVEVTSNQTSNQTKIRCLQPSIEAWFPYFTVEGQWRTHCQGNIGLTAAYRNLMKGAQLPAILMFVRDYRRTQRTDFDRERLVLDMDRIAKVRLLTPYTARKRLNQPFDQEKFNINMWRWRTGTLDEARMVRLRYLPGVGGGGATQWSPPGKERIMSIVRDIEKTFNKTIDRRAGCPYPFWPSTRPQDWSWWACWLMMKQRLDSMRTRCNAQWESIDSIETLYLECIWQRADPECKEFLDLPLTVYARHPLRFTVAHRVHGQQMRTRWTSPEPQSINDRDDDLCNIDIESTTSNCARHNYSEAEYDDILADIDTIELATGLYDESAPPPPGIEDVDEDEEIITVDDADVEDEFDGEEIDEE